MRASGIGPNKLVAKVASDAEKPDGFLELTAEGARLRFAEASPGLVPGIGPKTVAEARGARHRDARGGSVPLRTSSSRSGSAPRLGPHLAALARFEDDRAIETVRIAKSESRETTFDRDLQPGTARAGAVPAHRGCATALEKEERRGRTIGIKVRFDDFSTVTRARSIDAPGERLAHGRGHRPRAAQAARPAPPRVQLSWESGWRVSTRAAPSRSRTTQLSLSL